MLEFTLEERPSKFFDLLMQLECGSRSQGAPISESNDRGGATRFGITIPTLKEYDPKLSLDLITRDQAEDVYLKLFYNKIKPQPVTLTHYHYFDIAVNNGFGAYLTCFIETVGDLNKIIQWRKTKYNRIVMKDPTQKVFIKGWLNRVDNINKYFKFVDIFP